MTALLAISAATSAYLLAPLPGYETKQLHARLYIICISLCVSPSLSVLLLLVYWLSKQKRTRIKPERVLSQGQVAHMASTVSLCLSAGVSPVAMWTVISRSNDPQAARVAAIVIREIEAGAHIPTVYRNLAEQEPRLRPLLALLANAYESGVSVAAGIAGLATKMLIREHDVIVQNVRTIGVKATLPLGGCFLPAFIVLAVVPLAASLI
jgi:hypothetical protein